MHLPEGHRAEQLVEALTHAMAGIDARKRLTLTWDQGSEMARHDLVADLFTQGVSSANPGSPWMRGTNENTNGLLRQYLPKATDLRVHTAGDLAVIETKLNNRPRKTLDWQTPAAIFAMAPDKVTVATLARIRPRTQVPEGGQFSAAVDTGGAG